MAETEGTLTALDVLRRDGWHQGWYARDDGRSSPACLIGAYARARTGDAYRWVDGVDEWEATVAAVIAEQFPDRVPPRATTLDPVPFFNDHDETTFADVELVLEKAQLRLDEVTADV